jgi:hypothetical protein
MLLLAVLAQPLRSLHNTSPLPAGVVGRTTVLAQTRTPAFVRRLVFEL